MTIITRLTVGLLACALLGACGDSGGDDDRSRPEGLVYRVTPATASQATADTVRTRLADVPKAKVTVAGDELTVTGVPAATAAQRVQRPGRLAVYDWEGSLLRATCKLDVTRPAPGAPDAALVPRRARAEDKAKLCGGSVRVVGAEADPGQPPPDTWWLLRDRPALTGADVVDPEQHVDQQTNEPLVTFELSPAGRRRFKTLTRRIARRGARYAGPGDPAGQAQHFAIVVDDRIVSLPYVDFRQNPDGIDGSNGAQISGGATVASARSLAVLLSSGPLPGRVERISGG